MEDAKQIAKTLICRILSSFEFSSSVVEEGARIKRWIEYQAKASNRSAEWAFSPTKRDAYVFNARPFWQRNPTPTTQTWYRNSSRLVVARHPKSESTLYEAHWAGFKPFVRTRRTCLCPHLPKPAFALDQFHSFRAIIAKPHWRLFYANWNGPNEERNRLRLDAIVVDAGVGRMCRD
ncbi:hypothetical protein BASA62_003695 [Batrachochytrium salamandrivorans]|nr:hypothetical protein BASA62_003695 [Batrachochytrium salamandrivorans]